MPIFMKEIAVCIFSLLDAGGVTKKSHYKHENKVIIQQEILLERPPTKVYCEQPPVGLVSP